MKDQEFAVEKIRSQYTQQENTDLDALKALDARVKKPANVFGYVYGSIGTVIMGAGMSLVMTDIGTILGMTETLIPGIAVGVVGTYQKIEDGAVNGFRRVCDWFIQKLFSRKGETVEETRKRLGGK